MARLLVGLLDAWLPVVRGGELNDDPFAPISPAARAIVERDGDATPIDWLPRDRRYAEKLATPDITIADLIGEVDPIKVAEGRYLSDELTLHYGLIPRANRGIFAINELPDLAERIQVGLLNILEERDVQIRGFTSACRSTCSWSPAPTRRTTPAAAGSSRRSRTASARRSGRTTRARSSTRWRSSARRSTASRPRTAMPAVVVPGVHGGARRRADPPRPALARRSASARASASASRSPTSRSSRRPRSSAPSASASRSAAPRVSDLGAVVASTVGKVELEIGRRRVARGAGRRAADHQGAPHDVQPARRARRARGRRRGVRGRVHGRDRRSDAVARVRRAGCARCPGCRWRSAGSARST